LRAAGGLVERLPNAALRASLAVLLRRGHDDPRQASEALRTHYPPYARHGGASALIRQIRALDVSDTRAVQDRLPELADRPARVVWGAADPFQKIRYGRRFADELRCPLVPIAGGKHFVPEDHPDVLARAIREVVGEVEGQAQPFAAEE
jgi:pimeloyl-ACP methyl ester carboxylesterase